MLRRLGWFALLVVLYMWFSDAALATELSVALVSAFVLSLFIERVRSIVGRPAAAPAAGVAALGRVPLGLVVEAWYVLGPVLAQALFRPGEFTGRWIAVRYEPADDTPGRRSIVVLGSGITPNSIPLAIEPERGRMLLHQLKPVRDPGADHPRFPL